MAVRGLDRDMAFRQFLRGRVEWPRLEGVARELADRYDESVVRGEFLDADNWLSTPCVVDEQWFVKVISPQHALLHGLLTAGRNIGAFSSGQEGFFERFEDPVAMAEHELEATRRMRDIGVNAPAPVEAFEHDGLGVLVLEYLPEFTPLSKVDEETALALAPALFAALRNLHDHDLAHGDLRGENVLVAQGDLYFIDATNVRADDDALERARSYDLACALGVLAPLVGAREAVAAALDAYTVEELLAARDFLDFVNLRPDHDFEGVSVKSEIERAAN